MLGLDTSYPDRFLVVSFSFYRGKKNWDNKFNNHPSMIYKKLQGEKIEFQPQAQQNKSEIMGTDSFSNK